MKGLIFRILADTVDVGGIPCAEGGCDMTGGAIVSTIVTWAYALLGLVAVVIIVVSGIQYIISQGEPEKTKKAQATITYTVWGLVIATAAILIVRFVVGALS